MKRLYLTSWFFVLMFFASEFEASATISTARVATGLARPTYVTSPIGDSNRLFITEQHSGEVKILNLDTGVINPTPFLTVTGLSTGGDQGLLSMAFHPDYASNGLFYTVSSDTSGDEIIQQYQVSGGDSDIADPNSKQEVLRIPYGSSAHYGSWIGFNPKLSPTDPQYLYMTTGDGNGQGDIGNEAQDLSSLFGKVLRIDVNGDDFPTDPDKNYSIPADNPFVGVTGEDEIWAYGLRNPWRASFDRQTGDLYIADVGWNTFEEINFQPASSTGGENYGWRLREGFIETPTTGVGGPKPPGAVDPIHVYGRSEGTSITGGYAYRGSIPELQGQYFYGDFPFANDKIWSLEHDGTVATSVIERDELFPADIGSLDWISSFGEDGVGELYVISYGNHWSGNQGGQPAGSGEVFKIIFTLSPHDGDFDDNGVVDGADFLTYQRDTSVGNLARWETNYGYATAAAALTAVPEPASLVLALFSLLALRLGRSRKA